MTTRPPSGVLVVTGLTLLVLIHLVGASFASCDIDFHSGNTELYRQGFSDGVWWPHDRASGAGMALVGLYNWPCELVLGAIAWMLGMLGVPQPAHLAATGAAVLACAVLPLAAGRLSHELVGSGDRETSRRAWMAGAIAAACFLAMNPDSVTGYGLIGALRAGIINQAFALPLLLWALAAAVRLVRAPNRIDAVRFVLLVGATFWCHTMTAAALVAFVAVLGFANGWSSTVRLGVLGVIGTAIGGIALVPQLAWGGEIIPVPYGLTEGGMDPLTGVMQGWNTSAVLTVDLVVAGAGALFLLMATGFLFRCGGDPVHRHLGWGAVLLTAVVVLGGLRLLMPYSLHPYRFLSHAGLVLLVIGAARVASHPLTIRWSAQVRPALGAIWLIVAWTSLLFAMGAKLPIPETPADDILSQGRRLVPHVPSGSRIVVAQQLDGHAFGIDRLKRGAHEWGQEWQVETLNSGHSLFTGRVGSTWVAGMNGAGHRMIGYTLAGYASQEEAANVLEELGVERIVSFDHPAAVPGPLAQVKPPIQRSPRFTPVLLEDDLQIWSLPGRPRIEAVSAPVELRHNLPRRALLMATDWAARMRARTAITGRAILSRDRQLAPDDVLIDREPVSLTEAVDADRAFPAEIRSLDQSLAEQLKASYTAFARLGPMLQATSPPSVPSPGLRWEGGQVMRMEGLVPGSWYLVRYAWNPAWRVTGGTLHEELSGFMLLQASATEATLTIRVDRLPSSVVGVLVTLIGLLTVAFAGAASDRAVHVGERLRTWTHQRWGSRSG
jgi:hypothetical protein